MGAVDGRRSSKTWLVSCLQSAVVLAGLSKPRFVATNIRPHADFGWALDRKRKCDIYDLVVGRHVLDWQSTLIAWMKMVLFGCNVFVAAFRGRVIVEHKLGNIFDLTYPSLTFIYGECSSSFTLRMGSRMVSFAANIHFVEKIALILSQGHNSSEIPFCRSAPFHNSERSSLTDLLRYRNGVWSYAMGTPYTWTSWSWRCSDKRTTSASAPWQTSSVCRRSNSGILCWWYCCPWSDLSCWG